jgi:hypothetical protein
MKIALMSGAYVNAGDFLIENRCRDLLKTNIPGAQVDVLKRNIAYDNQVEMLNSYDLIVFGGGPGFQKKIYPDKMPFVSDLKSIQTPIAILGWGWKGRNCVETSVYRKRQFTPRMLDFITQISENSKNFISCRDWYTVQMLKGQGFHHTVMTGCPAWYDMKRISTLSFQDKGLFSKPSPNIMISDAAFPNHVKYMRELLEVIRDVFPSANIKILLHRGITKYNEWLELEPERMKFQYEVEDISGSQEGFQKYDECDLHIGFRVHAHIYNLSMGNASILINEDARGTGVNDALGIRNLYPGKYLKLQLRDYFDFINATDMRQYIQSCENIKFYYTVMKKYINDITMRT